MNSEIHPKIFIYNPTCEIAIANGTVSYMPNKMLSRFEKDLDVLPMYFADEKDVVLVNQLPDQELRTVMQEAGISLPEFKLFESSIQDKEFVNSAKESLEPWGWSPRIHHIFKHLKDSCQEEFKNRPNAEWQADHKNLYSRKKALEVLNFFLDRTNDPFYIEKEQIATICTTVAEIEELINQWKQIVIKAPWSSSGRGLQVLRQSHLNDSIIQWINGTLDIQGYVMVEPLLDKKHDFSLQYHINTYGEVNYMGNGFFATNSNGQYDSNILGGMPTAMKEFLSDEKMQQLAEYMKEAMISCGIAQNYSGYLGIDCMLYRDKSGEMKLQPCLEINLRYNMGTLALIFDEHLHPETKGVFKVHFKPKSTFDQFHKEMVKNHPLKWKDGKWFEGYLPLVSFSQNKVFGAYLLLENTNQEIK
ncbi:hypothetical protein DF185_00720 [Marinifilum breve]|uniref:ATP-grasp domain-containing protein n=1 Tax=Marinifilum breve TaxID=2184082 RepID=A0A2V4A1Y6_9BACT|nr:hypothetical protein [Marinifilum breve]PXY02651.1 hypothetical protein DF185_00720 [Marinifilum breve]